MITRRTHRTATTVALLLGGLGLCGTVTAQNTTTRLLVQVTHLKPDMVDEWRALQQNEVLPALKKAGVETRTTLETLFGDRPEFITIRPLTSFKEFDGQGALQQALGERGAATLIDKITACETSTVRYIVNRQEEFTVGNLDAPIRVTTTYRVNPGAGPSYREFLRSQVLPLNKRGVQEGKIVGFSVSITGQGSPEPGLWIQTTYLPNAAALDAGGLAGQLLSDAEAQLLGARAAQLRTNYRNTIRRRVAELSY